jgi:hypothetical protein
MKGGIPMRGPRRGFALAKWEVRLVLILAALFTYFSISLGSKPKPPSAISKSTPTQTTTPAVPAKPVTDAKRGK